MLVPSSDDKVAFTKAVWDKVVTVLNRMEKSTGIVGIPPSIEQAMKIARPMRLRHMRGDMRHTEKEMQYEQELARWLVEKWAQLHDKSAPEIKFGPHN